MLAKSPMFALRGPEGPMSRLIIVAVSAFSVATVLMTIILAALYVARAQGQPVPVWLGPGALNFATGQVNVGTTAVQIVPTRVGRARVVLTNVGTGSVACGPTAAVTLISGDIIEAAQGNTNGLIKSYDTQSSVFCISSAANTVSYYELF
jgi:hypothetical protein